MQIIKLFSNYIFMPTYIFVASLVAQTVKNLPADARDLGLVPGLGRSPGEGNGNSLQYSCLENSKDRPWGHTYVYNIY